MSNSIIQVEWRDIEGYEGLYQISSDGRVKSLSNNKQRKERILSTAITSYNRNKSIGYKYVSLSKNSKVKKVKIHILVAKHFIENPNNLSIINHKDNNTYNNNMANLEWCSYQENALHSRKNRNTASKYPGVSYIKSINKWRAKTTLNKKVKYIGQFNDELDAYKAYLNFLKEKNISNKYT